MKILKTDGAWTGIVIACAVVVVIALGTLQYRWNREASDATGVRLADSLQLSMVNWHLDLLDNFSEIALMLRPGANTPGDAASEPFAQRFAEWQSIARYPGLVSNAYAVWPRAGAGEAHQLNPETGVFAPVPWPEELGSLSEKLAALPHAAAGDSSSGFGARAVSEYYSLASALRSWRFDPSIPALVRPASARAAGSADRGPRWIVAVLDSAVIERHLLPDLAHRYFQATDGLDYEVAVVAGSPSRVIYTSDPGFGATPVANADGRLDVFGRPLQPRHLSALYVFQPTSEALGPTAAVGITWFPLLTESTIEQDWQLIVRHRRGGSLGAFVAGMRRRGLAVSFGALLLLIISMSMLVVASSRAQRLARLQMDFVTAVSHELRTPLTIIGSAADNIAAGVVESKAKLQEYGGVIGQEVGHLSGLVERILQFAAMRDGRQPYTMEPLGVMEVVDAALSSTDGLIRAASFTIECDVAPDLPAVLGDRLALSQCLENLITNALKYGQAARWIGIRARAASTASGASEVQISVADRGIGIDAADLAHIFEPFYRSASVRAAQIHGTGLGLTLARQIAIAMGGSLEVTSEHGRGSTFTLRLAAAA